jgi:hypothetical protein
MFFFFKLRLTWKGAGVNIFPVLSRFALKFLYICNLLMVDFERTFATPFSPSLGLSGFMEWFDLLKPCFRGAPPVDRTFGIFKRFKS